VRGGRLDPWEIAELSEIAEMRADAEMLEARLEAQARELGRQMGRAPDAEGGAGTEAVRSPNGGA
jgi:hypothetical protein